MRKSATSEDLSAMNAPSLPRAKEAARDWLEALRSKIERHGMLEHTIAKRRMERKVARIEAVLRTVWEEWDDDEVSAEKRVREETEEDRELLGYDDKEEAPAQLTKEPLDAKKYLDSVGPRQAARLVKVCKQNNPNFKDPRDEAPAESAAAEPEGETSQEAIPKTTLHFI